MDVSSDFADLYQSPYVASLVDLLLEFVSPALFHTLLNCGWVVECPSFDPICLPNLLTCVAAWMLVRLCSIAAKIQKKMICTSLRCFISHSHTN